MYLYVKFELNSMRGYTVVVIYSVEVGELAEVATVLPRLWITLSYWTSSCHGRRINITRQIAACAQGDWLHWARSSNDLLRTWLQSIWAVTTLCLRPIVHFPQLCTVVQLWKMSRKDIVILNSSSPAVPTADVAVTPPPPSSERVVPSTSSPDSLPSPLAILSFNVDKRLKTGSKASRILGGTRVGFSSVSGLVKEGELNVETEGKKEPSQNAPQRTKDMAEKKMTKKSSHHFGKLTKPTKTLESRKSPRKQAVSWDLEDEEEATEETPNSRDRGKKSAVRKGGHVKESKSAKKSPTGEARKETEVKDARDKPKDETLVQVETTAGNKPKRQKKSTGKASKHFGNNGKGTETTESPEKPAQISAYEPTPRVDTEEAHLDANDNTMVPPPKRRLSWTPAPDTVREPEPQEVSIADLRRASLSPTSSRLDFSGLLQNFSYANAPETKKPLRDASPEKQSLKRKRIELIEVGVTSAATKTTELQSGPTKNAVKKKTKLTSVTAFATERFRTTEDMLLVPDDKVSEFFAPRIEASKSRSTSPAKAGTKQTKAKRTRKKSDAAGEKATKSKKMSAKNAGFEEPPLLKPEHAARHVAKHEQKHGFIFGTSSQFHRERSPTMLRAIQQSLIEVKCRDSGFIDIETIEAGTTNGKAGLWAAASNVDGGLLLSELPSKDVAMVDGQQFDQEQDSSLVILSQNPKVNEDVPQEDEAVFPWGTAPRRPKQVLEHPSDTALVHHSSLQSRPATTHSFSAIPQKRSLSPPLRLIIPATSPSRVALRNLSTNTSPERRRRGRSPKLKAANTLDPPTPERPRGRPRKDKTTESRKETTNDDTEPFLALSEIEDSEAESVPTPPRRRKNKKRTSGQLEIASSQDIDNAAKTQNATTITANGNGNGSNGNGNGLQRLQTKHPKWPDIASELFSRITAVVKGAPRGAVGRPSWYEKMLMYDPIVIEDLTAWLEGQGVGVPGLPLLEQKEGEDAPGHGGKLKGWMVQKWCEEKSVCCLWREGLRGGVRYGY